MYVKDKIMYHISNNDKYDDIWIEGNTIDNTKNFISDYYNQGINFNSFLDEDKLLSLEKLIDSCLDEQQDIDSYIYFLKKANLYLKNYGLLTRELALEECRKDNYPNLPSRKEAIWLCEKEQIKYWKQQLYLENISMNLYKLSVEGELFKTNAQLIPNKQLSYKEIYERALKYWNPDLYKLPKKSIEYLFKGKIKILKKTQI